MFNPSIVGVIASTKAKAKQIEAVLRLRGYTSLHAVSLDESVSEEFSRQLRCGMINEIYLSDDLTPVPDCVIDRAGQSLLDIKRLSLATA